MVIKRVYTRGARGQQRRLLVAQQQRTASQVPPSVRCRVHALGIVGIAIQYTHLHHNDMYGKDVT